MDSTHSGKGTRLKLCRVFNLVFDKYDQEVQKLESGFNLFMFGNLLLLH
jgi:hypothetical protein